MPSTKNAGTKPRTTLTIKQRKFVNEYVKTDNGVKTALKVYDTTDYSTANAISTENLQKPLVRQAIEDKMEAGGIGDELLIKEHRKIIIQDKDLSNKTKSIELAHKLRGNLKEQLQGTTNTLNINIKDSEAIRKRIDILTAKLLNAPQNKD